MAEIPQVVETPEGTVPEKMRRVRAKGAVSPYATGVDRKPLTEKERKGLGIFLLPDKEARKAAHAGAVDLLGDYDEPVMADHDFGDHPQPLYPTRPAFRMDVEPAKGLSPDAKAKAEAEKVAADKAAADKAALVAPTPPVVPAPAVATPTPPAKPAKPLTAKQKAAAKAKAAKEARAAKVAAVAAKKLAAKNEAARKKAAAKAKKVRR